MNEGIWCMDIEERKNEENTSVFVVLNEVREKEVAVKEAIREEKRDLKRREEERMCWKK